MTIAGYEIVTILAAIGGLAILLFFGKLIWNVMRFGFFLLLLAVIGLFLFAGYNIFLVP